MPKATVDPPAVRLLLFTSRACTVMTCVLVPLAVIEGLAGLTVECAATAGPGTKLTTVWLDAKIQLRRPFTETVCNVTHAWGPPRATLTR